MNLENFYLLAMGGKRKSPAIDPVEEEPVKNNVREVQVTVEVTLGIFGARGP